MIRTLESIEQLRSWKISLRTRNASLPQPTLGFVPTMGALHEGHLSLVRRAREQCDTVVASIFVNPLQFGPGEDLARYPRTFDQDRKLLESAGCHAVFAPSAQEMYPAGASTYVVEEQVSAPLCGEFRPGHFRGVATVVLKLFHLVEPTRAYFGAKDYQQCAVIQRMVRDLNVPVQLEICPTVREPDGLAMSSRNAYLSTDERERAPRIYQSLLAARQAWNAGERRSAELERIGREHLLSDPAFKLQYWELRDSSTLERLSDHPLASVRPVAAVAAYLGQTRLIDNLEF